MGAPEHFNKNTETGEQRAHKLLWRMKNAENSVQLRRQYACLEAGVGEQRARSRTELHVTTCYRMLQVRDQRTPLSELHVTA